MRVINECSGVRTTVVECFIQRAPAFIFKDAREARDFGHWIEENFDNIKIGDNLSFDIKDFDLSFVRGLSYENGLSTLTKFTSEIIYQSIANITKIYQNEKINILVCGGGRKNLTLIENIRKKKSYSSEKLKNYSFKHNIGKVSLNLAEKCRIRYDSANMSNMSNENNITNNNNFDNLNTFSLIQKNKNTN